MRRRRVSWQCVFVWIFVVLSPAAIQTAAIQHRNLSAVSIKHPSVQRINPFNHLMPS